MGLVGKKVKVYYDDNGQVKPRIGIVTDESISFLTFKNEYGSDAIPNCKIIRVEVLNG